MQIEKLSLRRRFVGKYRSRMADDYEAILEHVRDGRGLQLVFFAPRVVTDVFVYAPAGIPPGLEEVLVGPRGEERAIDYVLEQSQGEFGPTLKISLQSLIETTRLVLRLTPTDGVDYNFQVLLQDKSYLDGSLVKQAMAHASQGQFSLAISRLTDYEEISNENPYVNYYLADWHFRQGHLLKSEAYILAASARGNFELCREKYRELQNVNDATPVEEIRDLQKLSQQWEVGAQHGAVVLEMKREVLLEVGNGFHVEKRSEITEIRRASAARMLRQMSYLFTIGRESVIHSSCRIIRGNGDVEVLSDEHVTIADHQDNNPFIAIEDEKEFIWILPDLNPGDIVDSSFHMLCNDRRIDDQAHPFVVMQQCHSFFPTFRSSFVALAPKGFPVQFSTRNLDSDIERSADSNGKSRYAMATSHCVPFKQTGFEYESAFLNPVVAVTKEGATWKDVARSALVNTLGESPDTELPAKLQAIVGGQHDAKTRLEQAFYWIRDNIKYASMLSAKRRIGESGRAAKIVEGGVGDCADKSYLLHMVCNALQIPSHFALVPTKLGLLIEDLPAEQFDHIFVRASIDGQQIWMDAADGLSAFGSAPAGRQGLPALLLDEAGTIVTVPEDDPAQNRIEISEVFHGWRGDRLHGQYDLKAYGISGRMADEGFKSASLSIEDPTRAADAALRQYLPGAVIERHARESQATHSRLFHVSGSHTRDPILPLGNAGSEIGSLAWGIPALPVSYWRNLHIDRLFVLSVLLSVHIEVVFEGEAFAKLGELSTTNPLENDFCSISERVERGSTSCRIQRDLVFKRRFVEPPTLAHVAPSLEEAEKALRMIMGFHGREARMTR